jgi:hypothetical protein
MLVFILALVKAALCVGAFLFSVIIVAILILTWRNARRKRINQLMINVFEISVREITQNSGEDPREYRYFLYRRYEDHERLVKYKVMSFLRTLFYSEDPVLQENARRGEFILSEDRHASIDGEKRSKVEFSFIFPPIRIIQLPQKLFIYSSSECICIPDPPPDLLETMMTLKQVHLLLNQHFPLYR